MSAHKSMGESSQQQPPLQARPSSDDRTPTAAAPVEQVITQTPAERLSASRDTLRAWLQESNRRHAPPEPRGPDEPRASHAPHEEPSWMTAIFETLSDVPAATIAANWLRRWWNNHPWRTTLDLASAVATELAVPVAKRHPWLLLGGGVLAGVLATRLRPWRWISGTAIVAGLIPRLDTRTLLHWMTDIVTAMGHSAGPETDHDEGPPHHAGTASPDLSQAASPFASGGPDAPQPDRPRDPFQRQANRSSELHHNSP